MYKIGMSSCAFPLSEESFRGLSDYGVEAIEISLDGEGYEKLNYQEVMALSRRYGIRLWSCHLPFTPWGMLNISKPDPQVRSYTLDLYKELIRKASDIGVDKFVIHPSLEPIQPEEREEMLQCAMDSLNELAEFAGSRGAVVAVENLPRTCLGNTGDEMLKLISANEKLRVCFDTNHLFQDTHSQFIEKLGDKIVTLHVSDYDYEDEQHWLPGEGKINWPELIAKLEAAGYPGVWMYELTMNARPAIHRNRDLTFEDMVANAREIFAHRQPMRVC